ncbi:MAG: hypothetical protein JWN64_227 [Parcubacteria group bacterium]|nr:hypothetical protein [Parcubacteria group bacterium]
MENIVTVYNIFWSAGALVLGVFAAFFTRQFVAGNIKGLESLYRKTHFILFKKQAKEMGKPSMFFFSRMIGVVFILIGIASLLNICGLINI